MRRNRIMLCIFFWAKGRLELYSFFFFNDTATTEIYTLSLHDALPILPLQFSHCLVVVNGSPARLIRANLFQTLVSFDGRSEEHTSELQSQSNLVCRLLLEKKKTVAIASS